MAKDKVPSAYRESRRWVKRGEKYISPQDPQQVAARETHAQNVRNELAAGVYQEEDAPCES